MRFNNLLKNLISTVFLYSIVKGKEYQNSCNKLEDTNGLIECKEDHNGYVTELELEFCKEGKLQLDIKEFDHLEKLHFIYCDFTQSTINDIGNLKNLKD
eukprot:jgi/Orpsp1_1/1176608/evm.model.c7180000058292.1